MRTVRTGVVRATALRRARWSLLAAAMGVMVPALANEPAPIHTTPVEVQAQHEPQALPPLAPLPSATSPSQELEAGAASALGDIQPMGATRMLLKESSYLRGVDELRVVRRVDTQAGVAAQVAFNVVTAAVLGSVSFESFSKTALAGSPVEELQDEALAANPGMHELLDAMSIEATRVYRARVEKRLAQGREEGWTREEMLEEAQVQAEADWPLNAGNWHLIYENLMGDDELYRLHLSAALGRPGFMRPPLECAYQSEPVAWAQWMADDWRLLREEKVKAVAQCTQQLATTPDKYW